MSLELIEKKISRSKEFVVLECLGQDIFIDKVNLFSSHTERNLDLQVWVLEF